MVEGAQSTPLQGHPIGGTEGPRVLLQRIGGVAPAIWVFRHGSIPTQSWQQPEETHSLPKSLAHAENGCNSRSGCSVTLLTVLAITAPLYNLAPFSCKVGILLQAASRGGLHKQAQPAKGGKGKVGRNSFNKRTPRL